MKFAIDIWQLLRFCALLWGEVQAAIVVLVARGNAHCYNSKWKFFKSFSHSHTKFPHRKSTFRLLNTDKCEQNIYQQNQTPRIQCIRNTNSNQLIWYFVIQWYATAAAKCSVDYFNLFVVVAVFDFCLALCTIDHFIHSLSVRKVYWARYRCHSVCETTETWKLVLLFRECVTMCMCVPLMH